jgi:hypothetical protein
MKPPCHTGTVGMMVSELRDRKEHLLKELEYIDIALTALEKAWQIDACLATDDAVVNQIAAQIPTRNTAAELKGISYSDAAERVLQRIANRRAIATRTLMARMEAGGKKVRGKDPYRILYRTLMKDARFTRVEGKWALSEWYPPADAPVPNVGEREAAKENAKKQTVN